MMQLKRPVLLLDKAKCLRNIQKMISKAHKYQLAFRPHFKTHQSAEIGEWFRKEGVSKITVSSVMMAEYFANHGWDDITIAFPVNVAEASEINKLAERVSLNILIESHESLQMLTKTVNHSLGVFLKIDAGYHRTGIPIENQSEILALISEISNHKNLVFKGFLIHNGHTYSAKGKNEIQEIHGITLHKIRELKQFSEKHRIKSIVSIGDTPAMSVVDDFSFVDEIRPGNFVFYDVMQQNIGSCSLEEIAVALAVPVVAKHPERNEFVVYGGAVHLSKDSVLDNSGNQIFGRVVLLNEMGWGEPVGGTYVKSLSQEHGIIKTTDDFIKTVSIGDFIGILPVHSCLTAHLMGEYLTFRGERITTMLVMIQK